MATDDNGRTEHDFGAGWIFSEGFEPAFASALQSGVAVDVPHTAVELPLAYCDETSYQRAFTYQKHLPYDDRFADRQVHLRFDGAMADAEVFVDGESVATHADGYTPFEVELTSHVRKGGNLITVRIDGTENPAIPPFGGQIDYLTYAGLYRDITLRVSPLRSIEQLRVDTCTPPDALPTVEIVARLRDAGNGAEGGSPAGEVIARLIATDGKTIAEASAPAAGERVALQLGALAEVDRWDIDDPALYRVVVEWRSDAGVDRHERNVGFRSIAFDGDGFRLNGRPLKLLGLNRHQSFPHAGYALGRGPQERDAEIVKHELGCNVVRSSHYPASPWFLDHCDRIGLLVLEEIPGWQHIGDTAWQAASIENVRGMIERDRHHPSIISWGVRINESPDDHDFYEASNALARALDPHRPTSGIRCHEGSELLEDLYTMNDFVQGSEVLSGSQAPRVALRRPRDVTGLDTDVPYLVTEYNGHMFPTKASDPEEHQNEHVARHLDVLDAMFGDPNVAGCIGWCAFDYQTHADFGAGDRVCHHGVMTMFREPKFAASVYASQADPRRRPVLTPVTRWARGERAMGGVLPLTILTNLDEIEMRFEDTPWRRFRPARKRYPHLPHPPVLIELSDLDDAAVGSWGLGWRGIEIAGFLDGEEVVSTRFLAAPLPSILHVEADKTRLDAAGREEVRVAIGILDAAGHALAYLAESVDVDVSGAGRLLGPASVPLLAGRAAFWVRAIDRGDIEVHVSTGRLPTGTIQLQAE